LRNTAEKIAGVTELLKQGEDGLPAVSLSIGTAFSADNDGSPDSPETLFKKADQAFYKVKEADRDGFAFYEEEGTT